MLQAGEAEVGERAAEPARADQMRQEAQAAVGPEHVALRRLGQEDRAPHADEVRDPVGLGAQLQERE
jgi:hypothetical protein